MAYDPTNLPYLPDGSPNPDYQWKGTPGYEGVSEQERGLAQGLGYGGPGGDYLSGTGAIKRALEQGGGFSAIKPLLGRLSKFMMKGGEAAAAYEKRGLRATRKGAMEGMNILRGQQGQAGGLASTVAGVSDVSLMSEALGQADTIRANAASMKEANIMNRFQMGIQGLSAYGQLAGDEQQAQIRGGYALSGLGMQQTAMGHGFDMDQLGMLEQQRREQEYAAFDRWTANQRAPKSGGPMPWVMGAAEAYAGGMSPFSGWGFGGGGGKTDTRKRGW